MKPGKYQRSKQRCQDFCLKVHDRVQSFGWRSYTMNELRNQTFLLDSCLSVRSKQLLCVVHGQGHKKNKTYNKELSRVS